MGRVDENLSTPSQKKKKTNKQTNKLYDKKKLSK